MQKVRVFLEIKSRRWTVWSEDGKKHLGYRESLALKDVTFHVDDIKRKRVKKSGKKFPHAYAKGFLLRRTRFVLQNDITYNPMTHRTFKRNNRPVEKVRLAKFCSDLRVKPK